MSIILGKLLDASPSAIMNCVKSVGAEVAHLAPTIKQNNSDTRHYFGRMTRRTKVVSKSEEMLNISMKLLCALQNQSVFDQFQNIFLSIYN
jgi:hypothetical protein